MKSGVRSWHSAAGVAAAAAFALLVSACGGDASDGDTSGSSYPERTITFIVPYGPGGSTDIIGREFVKGLEEELGATITVQNQQGAQGTVGTGAIVSARGNGYTVGMSTGNVLAFQPTRIDGLPWSSSADYTPIAKLASEAAVLSVKADSPYQTLADLIQASKDDPGSVQVALAGLGSPQDLAIKQLNQQSGGKLETVAFSGGGAESLAALLGGRTVALAGQSAYLKGHVDSGEVRPLTTLSQEPNPILPDVPTLADNGFEGGIASDFYFIAPKGLPDDVLEKLSAAAQVVLSSDSYKKFADELGYTLELLDAGATKKQIDEQEGVYAELAPLLDQ